MVKLESSRGSGTLVLGIIVVVLGAIILWGHITKIGPIRVGIPKKGPVTWNIEKLRMPIFRGELISEIFADEARSVDGEAIELDNPIIFYYGPQVITKITGKKGTGELVNGELKNLKVWGHTHVERRNRNANTDVERLRGTEDLGTK